MSLQYLFVFNFRYEWSWKRETIWLARVSHCIILVNKPWKVIPRLLFFVTSVQQIHHKIRSVSMPGLFAETFLYWRKIRMTDIKQQGRVVCLFVCLFVCIGFLSHSKNFHSCGDVTITGEELHSIPWSSEVHFTCHTYCDTEYSCILCILWSSSIKDPWHSHLVLHVLSNNVQLPYLWEQKSNLTVR